MPMDPSIPKPETDLSKPKDYIGGDRIETRLKDGKDEQDRPQTGDSGEFEAMAEGRAALHRDIYPANADQDKS